MSNETSHNPSNEAVRDVPQLWPISEAARQLGVSTLTVKRWDRAGKIKSVRTLGGHRRYEQTEIDRVKAVGAAEVAAAAGA